MKNRASVLLVACASSLAFGPVGAQTTFTELDGQEILYGHVEGQINCRGSASPTGDFASPCGEGVAGQIRDRKAFAYELTGNPLFTGIATIAVNANFDENGEGPMWGTVSMDLVAGGTIEGSYTGKANITNTSLELHGIGHGTGGIADGLQFHFEVEHVASPYGALAVRILNPGSKH